MELIACGVFITTKLSKIEGIITAQSLRFDKIIYEISYFNNGDYKQIWMHENEFEILSNEKICIGFKK